MLQHNCSHTGGALDVTIIIVAWNVRFYVDQCVASIFEQTGGITFGVIHVDNGSTDKTVQSVITKYPTATVIQNQRNLGFIKANNQAIRMARGRYGLLLNSDTIVFDKAIAKTIRFADLNPSAAVVGCKVLNRDKSLQRRCFMHSSLLNLFLTATYLSRIFRKVTSSGESA